MRADAPRFPNGERHTFSPAASPLSPLSTQHALPIGQSTSTPPLCLPSASVLIPPETTPRTSEPSHDPPSTLPHVPRPKSPQVQDVHLLHVCSRSFSEIVTAHTRERHERRSVARVPPRSCHSVCHSRRGREGGAPRREAPRRQPPRSAFHQGLIKGLKKSKNKTKKCLACNVSWTLCLTHSSDIA